MSIYSMKRNLEKRWNIFKNLWLPFSKYNVSHHAASACFYVILSLLPASALGMTIFSLIPTTAPVWAELINALIPNELRSIAAYFISSAADTHRAGLFSSWLLLTLWSASKGIMSIAYGLSVILGKEDKGSFIRRRLRAMIVFLLLLTVVFATMVFIVFGAQIFSQLTQLLPAQSGLLLILYHLRYAFTLFLLSVIFSIFFKLLQTGALTFSSCIKCGIISSAGWLSLSLLFSFYVNHFQNYERNYGSLGLLLLACLWLQIVISLLLYSVIYIKMRQDGSYRPIEIIKKALLL